MPRKEGEPLQRYYARLQGEIKTLMSNIHDPYHPFPDIPQQAWNSFLFTEVFENPDPQTMAYQIAGELEQMGYRDYSIILDQIGDSYNLGA